jgi:hypothetical protein
MPTGEIIALVGFSIATLVLSVGIAGWILVRVPPDYFKGETRRPLQPRPFWMRVIKNIGGAVLLLVGVILSIPGVPGQGLLMVLAGLMLVDLPGKYKLERKLVSFRPLFSAANRLRAWRHRPPLEFPSA